MKLNLKQRISVATLYIVTLMILYFYLNNNFKIFDQNNEYSTWFYSGVLLLIMGRYLTEPYFTTPTDALANGVSVFLLLIQDNEIRIIGTNVLIILSISLVILSFFNMFSSPNTLVNNISFYITKTVGKSVVLYSLVFLSATITYFSNSDYLINNGSYMFLASILLWISIVFFDIYAYLILAIIELFSLTTDKITIENFGSVVKNTGDIFFLELEKTKFSLPDFEEAKKNSIILLKTCNSFYTFFMFSDLKELSNSFWIRIKPIKDIDNYKIDIPTFKNIFGLSRFKNQIGDNYIINIDDLAIHIQETILNDVDYTNRKNHIGDVLVNSNLNIINFSILNNQDKIKEGSILSVYINNKEVLYQTINGITQEDLLSNGNRFDYISGVARKLGNYDTEKNELNTVNWMPNMNTSVYLYLENDHNKSTLKTIANKAIGRLPNTTMMIPIKDIDSLVTHNTAILGVLGVGKSYLTFELIKKIIENGTKVICIDITNQYASENGLFLYIDAELVQNDFVEFDLSELSDKESKTGNSGTPSEWGNTEFYRSVARKYVKAILSHENKSVLILNPNNHNVSKAASNFNITESTQLSLVEKTKIITEVLLEEMMQNGQSDKAKCCIVLEEGHSLAPEWNSVVVEGDNNHSNGISRVILQGRKFGLGCILITQRTANVTKNILNQCNTIFAMRVFDDTGKSFLENYIGKGYSDVLPTLEERHAIVTGKGIGVKQPVVIELNDAKYVQKETFSKS